MSAVWPNLTHFRLWKVSLLKTRWARPFIGLFQTGHEWDPLCKRKSLFAIISSLMYLFVIKIKLSLPSQTVSRIFGPGYSGYHPVILHDIQPRSQGGPTLGPARPQAWEKALRTRLHDIQVTYRCSRIMCARPSIASPACILFRCNCGQRQTHTQSPVVFYLCFGERRLDTRVDRLFFVCFLIIVRSSFFRYDELQLTNR